MNKRKPLYLLGTRLLLVGGFLAISNVELGERTNESSLESGFRIVEWNVANNLSEENVRYIFRDYSADIAVFPELGGSGSEDIAQRLTRVFSQAGLNINEYDFFVHWRPQGILHQLP